jgi:hypothetical protein
MTQQTAAVPPGVYARIISLLFSLPPWRKLVAAQVALVH